MNMGSYNCCKINKPEFKQVNSLSTLLNLVAESNRLKLLCLLRQGGHCVCNLIDHVSLSQSLVSHHLKDLKDAGLISCEKRGLRVYYWLTKKGKHITNLLFKI